MKTITKITDKLISKKLAVYIKGWFIEMNASVVLDIYGYCMGHTNNEFFFSRDVEKAFDSVQWFF